MIRFAHKKDHSGCIIKNGCCTARLESEDQKVLPYPVAMILFDPMGTLIPLFEYLHIQNLGYRGCVSYFPHCVAIYFLPSQNTHEKKDSFRTPYSESSIHSALIGSGPMVKSPSPWLCKQVQEETLFLTKTGTRDRSNKKMPKQEIVPKGMANIGILPPGKAPSLNVSRTF